MADSQPFTSREYESQKDKIKELINVDNSSWKTGMLSMS